MFLPIHPTQPKNVLKPLKTKKSCDDIQSVCSITNHNPPPILSKINGVRFHPTQSFIPPSTGDSDGWKIDWINKFDQTRNEKNAEILKWKTQFEMIQSEYKQLKKKYEAQKKTVRLVTIGTQTKWKQKNVRTQTHAPATTASISVQTEATSTSISTQTEAITTSNATQTESVNTNTTIPDQTPQKRPIEMQFDDPNPFTTPTNYQCHKCQKFFNKKSSLVDHQTETACAGEKILEWRCEVCYKMFTYRGLRVHYAQYIETNHKARGKHAELSPADHRKLLDDHRSSKH